jgi:hypothetical protein
MDWFGTKYCRRSPGGREPHRFTLTWCKYCGARAHIDGPCRHPLGHLWERACTTCGRAAPKKLQRQLAL